MEEGEARWGWIIPVAWVVRPEVMKWVRWGFGCGEAPSRGPASGQR
jgi:hypothetical protein